MNKLFKSGLAIASIFMFIIVYSCTKENVTLTQAIDKSLLVENRSSGLCEEAEGICAGPYLTTTLIFPGGIPSYQNCTMSIVVNYRVCPDGIDMVYVGPISIQSTANDPDCAQAQLDTNDPATALAAFEIMEAELLELALIKLGVEESLGSGLLPICGETQSAVSLRMTRAACAKACLFPDPTDPRGISFIFLPCGNNCCQSLFELCFDTTIGKVKLTQISNSVPASPCELNPPVIPCPPNTIITSDCRPRCANIAQGG